MKKSIYAFALLFIFCIGFFIVVNKSFADNLTPQKVKSEFLKIFPNTQNIKYINETPIAGLWAIHMVNKAAGLDNVIYFYPKKQLIFFGEIWDKNGKNLTFSDGSSLPDANQSQPDSIKLKNPQKQP